MGGLRASKDSAGGLRCTIRHWTPNKQLANQLRNTEALQQPL